MRYKVGDTVILKVEVPGYEKIGSVAKAELDTDGNEILTIVLRKNMLDRNIPLFEIPEQTSIEVMGRLVQKATKKDMIYAFAF